MKRTHYYLSVNILGDIYSVCGVKCGHVSDNENCCWGEDGFLKKITCKNCRRTRIYKDKH